MIVRTTVKSIQDIMRQDVGVDGDAQRISQLCWMFFLKIIDDQDQELELTRDDYRSPIPKKYQWRTWAADPETFVNDELFPALKNLSASSRPGDRRRVVRDVFEDAYNYMKSGQLMRQVVNRINEVDFNNLKERQHFGEFYEQLLNDLQSAGNAGEYYTPRAVTAFMADRIDPHPGEILLDPACGTGGFLTCAINHMRKRYVKRPEHEAKMQAALRAVEKKQLPHMLCVTNKLLHGIEDPSFVRHDNTLARPYISYTQSDRADRPFEEKKTIPGGFAQSAVRLNQFVRDQPKWTAQEITARTEILAQRAIALWPALSVSQSQIDAANYRDMRELAARRDVGKVEMSAEARALFDKLREHVLMTDTDVLELAEPNSVSYHSPAFFLEVLPRRYTLTLLLAMDFNEIDDPAGVAQDATQREFFIHARHEGGVSVSVSDDASLQNAIPLIRQAMPSSSRAWAVRASFAMSD